MKTTWSTTTVRAIPEKRDGIHQLAFYRELESCIDLDRPKVVLDCSSLSQLDQDSVYLLLCCLEEAMRRNGDVRLAALQPKTQTALNSAGLDRIFQTFDSVEEAVESFRPQRLAASPGLTEANEDRVQSSAA